MLPCNLGQRQSGDEKKLRSLADNRDGESNEQCGGSIADAVATETV